MCDEIRAEAVEVETLARNAPHGPQRRSFLRILGGAILALITLPATWAKAKKVGLPLEKVADLQKVGGSKVLKIKDVDVLVIRDAEGSVRAINPVCTHKKCQVKYKADSNDLFCKCHKSAFKLDGTVVAGPAPAPLTTYPASLENEQIVITLPD